MQNEYKLGGGYIKGHYTTNHTYYILDLWVHPAARGNKIATHLMQEICHDADVERVELVLECVPDLAVITHEALENFYLSFGFQRHGKLAEMRRLPLPHV